MDYNVTGMSCAACSARVEKAVSKVEGVTSCSVNLLTNSMTVDGSAEPEKIIGAVTAAGYGAALKGSESRKAAKDEEALKDKETPKLIRRLLVSLGFLAVLMYFSMGHMMLGLPVPEFFEDNHAAMGILQMLLAAIVMVINQKFFINGFKGIMNLAPNMDTLVALGSASGFIWSVYALMMVTEGQLRGNHDIVMTYMNEFYFESSAMILTLVTVGKMLEARSKGKTTDALKGLMKLAPKEAVLVRDGVETIVPIERVKVGDIFAVRAGEDIPVDGVVIEGAGTVNEAALTGESIPVDKEVGDNVSVATVSNAGYMKCRATRVGEDTTLSHIIKMVSDASSQKAPIAKLADRVSGIFVPTVITIAVITIIIWLALGRDFGYALARGISVLVISCPCALGLATPVAIMVGSGVGAKNGILFKTAVSLEETGKIGTVVLDKTGTITSGEPVVTDVIPSDEHDAEELLNAAGSLEYQSEHPLAKAVVSHCESLGIKPGKVSEYKTLAGNGVSCEIDGRAVIGGSLKYISSVAGGISEETAITCKNLSCEGKTPLLFVKDGSLLGVIAVADAIKEDSPKAISELKKLGLKVIMLTGDNENTAKAIGKAAGVDDVISGVMPGGKEEVVRRLQESGKVAMVGDGINDAPALTRADIGIAIGAGSDIAIDAADVVLMKSSLTDVAAAIRLSRSTLLNIKENLFWAFIYNMIGIPLAMGAFTHFGITLNPMFGAAAMSLSSFCVVTNALRLNYCKLYGRSKGENINRAEKPKEKEKKTMVKTILVDGMMCPHCEKHVKDALMAVPGVEAAEASHVKGEAVVTLKEEVADSVLKETVEKAGYTVNGIK